MAPDTPQDDLPPREENGHAHLSDWEALAVDYLDGRLAPSARALVDAHLATCVRCRRDLDDQRAVRTMFGDATMAAPPLALADAVLGRLLAAGPRKSAASPGPGVAAEAAPPAADALPAAGAMPTTDDSSPRDRERSAGTPVASGRGRRNWLSGLLRPRVWLPAAATLLLAVVLLSQFHQPATRVAVESSKNASAAATAAATATTAAAAATAPLGTIPGRQAYGSAAQDAATSTTLPTSASAASTTAPAAPGQTAPAAESGAGAGFAGRSLWITVGNVGSGTAGAESQTARLLALLARAVPDYLPAGTTPPVNRPPLYVASVSAEEVPALLADLEAAGLNPRAADVPPTIQAASEAIAAATVFPPGSPPDAVAAVNAPAAGLPPGQALLLVHVVG